MNGVVNLRTGKASGFESHADLHAFYRLNGHNGLSNSAVKLEIPLRVRTKPKGNALYSNLDDPSECITRISGVIDQCPYFFVLLGTQRIDDARVS